MAAARAVGAAAWVLVAEEVPKPAAWLQAPRLQEAELHMLEGDGCHLSWLEAYCAVLLVMMMLLRMRMRWNLSVGGRRRS